MKPFPTQIDGARFLAQRTFAVLADDPRVGKTGAAVMAADMVLARNILVVTTASGKPVLERGFRDWSVMGHDIQVAATGKAKLRESAAVVITGWPNLTNPALRAQLLARSWDLLLLDESHYAKNVGAARTQAVYGSFLGEDLNTGRSLAGRSRRVWCLSGTLMPNSPLDLFPMLRFGAPDRIAPYLSEEAFLGRFCEWRPKKIGYGAYARSVRVIMGGKNLDDLKARLDGLILRRTQADVGILAPIYATLPLAVPASVIREAATRADLAEVLKAIESGDTKALDMALGPLRRLTGLPKAAAIAALVRDEFECGLDKVVLAYWHREVGDKLAEMLEKYGVVRLDGSTPDKNRPGLVAEFSTGTARVFLAQAQAAAEAIDLSAAAELIFVEMSSTPKDGVQMAFRITNHSQTRRPRVRVGAIAGSIDEAMQAALLRKMQTVTEVMK